MTTSVHLWPVEGAFIPGVPAVECDVTRARAAELLAHSPPAFTTSPPAGARPAATTDPAGDGGIADSTPGTGRRA